MQTQFRPVQRKLIAITAIVIGAFILGLVGGALAIDILSPSQLAGLQQYLDGFLRGVGTLTQSGQFPALKAWSEIVRGQLYVLAILWLLGLCAIGAPLIILMVCARGFILGFTIGFLVKEKAGQGLLLALAAVLPQNICYVPGLAGAAILALYFTLSLLGGPRDAPVMKSMTIYTLLYIALTLLVLIGAWIEAFLVPGIMRLAMLL